MAVQPFPAASAVRSRTLDAGRIVRAIVPAADVCVLVAAVMIAGVTAWTVSYAAIVLVGLHHDPARAGRIRPQLSTDVGWLFARAAAPLVVLLPVAEVLGADPNWAVLAPTAVTLLFLVSRVGWLQSFVHRFFTRSA